MAIDLVPGTVVRQYRVVRLIAHGGIASTYEVEDVRGGARFAMKRLSLGELRDWKSYELFEREARVLSGVRHPSIPRYVEHFEHEHSPGQHAYYLVQELAPGASLADRVAKGWRCDEAQVRQLAVQLLGILRDLQALTPPVFHRDVKPHNVLRSDDGRLFLVDFGAVRDAYRTLTGGSTVVGTYGYMAPEQLRGVALPATDVYGVASTVLFLLTGAAPNDLPQRGLRPDFRAHVKCSPSLAAWLDRALEPKPEKRFASAREAYDALRAVPGAEKKRSTARVAILGGVLVALAVPTAFFARNVTKEVQAAKATAKARGGRAALIARPPSERFSIRPKTLLTLDVNGGTGTFSVDASPDSRTLAIGGGDGSLRLADATTGATKATFAGSPGRVYSLRFTRDGQRLVSGAGKRVDVWDVSTHRPLLGFEADAKEVAAVRPSLDDRWLATSGGADHAVKLWDLATGKPSRTLAPAPSAMVSAIAFTPDGKIVAAAGEDPIVRMWSTESGALLATCPGHTRTVDDLVFSPDGLTLYSTSDDHTLRVWSGAECRPLAVLGDHGDEVWSVATNPNGDLVATGSKDGWVHVWDTGKNLLKWKFQTGPGGVTRLSFLPNGAGLATSLSSGRVGVWQIPAPAHAPLPIPVVRDPPVIGAAPTPTEACDRARALIDASNGRDLLDEASLLANGALAKSPHFAPAYCALARIALRRGYISGRKYEPTAIEEAKKLLARVSGADANLPEVHFVRGWILRASDDAAGASREATLAESAGPTSAADTLLSVLHSDSLDTPFEVAEHYGLRALTEKPTRGEAWMVYMALERAYEDAGDYDAADRAYRAQIDVDPDSVWAKGNYAHFLVGIGDYPHAVDAAERALAQMDYGSARSALGNAHAEAGVVLLWDFDSPEKARAEFEAAVAADPSNAKAHYGLGAYWKVQAVSTGDPAAADSAKVETAKWNALAKK